MPTKRNHNHHNSHTPPYSTTNCYFRPKKLRPCQSSNLCNAHNDKNGTSLIAPMELQDDRKEEHTVWKIGQRST
ncbi:hypothetical protein RHMOL_Rhmol10G0147500 [Rhododendron molle]|uniref:Uncharacterized protein n=1 Tax=Rhododendron molle TaxID=49168 RepID=A0ACC0M2U7_RHOML|nr:hypothetical protein RHMOL_Rhmol10G0147500 [Rhododendron molle]